MPTTKAEFKLFAVNCNEGGWHYLKHKTQGAAVLALVKDKFIVIKEPRLSSSEELVDTLNCPRGAVDLGESPRSGAARELREESGIEVDPARLLFLGFCFADGGSLATPIHLFGLRISPLEWDCRQPIVEQELEPLLLKLSDSPKLFRRGILTDAITAHLLMHVNFIDSLEPSMEKLVKFSYEAKNPLSDQELKSLRKGLQLVCNNVGLCFDADKTQIKISGWAYGDSLTLARLPTQIEYLAKKSKMIKRL